MINRTLWIAAPALAAIVLAVYWPTFTQLAWRWSTEPQYSHGYLVPLFSAFLLWHRKGLFRVAQARPSYVGLLFVLGGTVLRLTGAYYHVFSLDRFSLPLILTGLCVGLGGWHALRWAWPSLAFLLFMLPLPQGVESWLAHPLQRVTTLISTHVLQTFGYLAEAEGNVIVLAAGDLGVAEACSGLRMLVVFGALSTAVAIISRRSALQRLLLVVSAVPIAVVCNTIRIVLTAILFSAAGPGAAEVVFHDLAGWLMIGLAGGLLALELWLFAHLLVPASRAGPSALIAPRVPAPAEHRAAGAEMPRQHAVV
jgi:exosortase